MKSSAEYSPEHELDTRLRVPSESCVTEHQHLSSQDRETRKKMRVFTYNLRRGLIPLRSAWSSTLERQKIGALVPLLGHSPFSRSFLLESLFKVRGIVLDKNLQLYHDLSDLDGEAMCLGGQINSCSQQQPDNCEVDPQRIAFHR